MDDPVYCTAADISTYALRGAALTGISSADIDNVIKSSSAEAASYFASRFPLPLLAWGTDVVSAVAKIAASTLLGVRGWNPELGSDVWIQQAAVEARMWLKACARQEAQPNVTPSPPVIPVYDQPRVISETPVRWTQASRKVF